MITIQQLSNALLLEKSWKAVRRKKSKEVAKFSRGIDNVTLADFERNKKEKLASILQRLRVAEYVPQAVKFNLIEKGNDKFRLIAIPTIEDRVVQRSILEFFEPFLSPIINNGVSYCGVRDEENETVNIKNAIEKVVEHVGKGYFWVFESDIVSFYDEISKAEMLEKLNAVLPMDNSIYDLVRKYIYYEVGNPQVFEGKSNMKIPSNTKGITQGSALSPIFANLFLSDFDAIMKKAFGNRYIRYVDDFIVMCASEQESKIAMQLAFQEIKKVNLELSPEGTKTHRKNLKASENIDFLGITINRDALLPKGGIKAPRKHMDEILTWNDIKTGRKQYKKTLVRNGQELDVADQIREKIISWGEHYRYYHVDELYEVLDDYIGKKTHQMSGVSSIIPLKDIVLTPVISKEVWQNFFRR